MSKRPTDAPTLAMVLTGGIGVLVVVAFVGAVAFGRGTTMKPGDRIAVVSTQAPPPKLVFLVGRCTDERVRDVEVLAPDGTPLWEIHSAKGGINRSYVLGEDPPFGFETKVALRPLPPGTLQVRVVVDDVTDARSFDPLHLEQGRSVGAPCGSRDIGIVPLLFLLGGAGVVLAYGAMVRRFVVSR